MNFPYLGETEVLNERTRTRAGSGAFIQLPDGVTHYELGGPESSQAVVLVHGFSVPYFIYDPTFSFLTQAGFRVLRYDLFGRGWSDRPRVKYNVHFFVKQLAGLLDALHFGPVNLAGLSMGGPITAAFTHQYPERVSRLILIDPAGARPIDISLVLKAAKLPLMGRLILGLVGSGNLVKSAASDFFDPKLIREFQPKYMVQMKYKGFMRAILSSVRNGMLDSFYETYQRLGKLQKPTLLIWGRNDTTVPFAHSDDLRAAMPHAEFHAIEDCGHIPHYERPEIFNPILERFLKC